MMKFRDTSTLATSQQEQKEVSDQASCTYSPLSLCNQAMYPGDDKLLVMEKEILEIKYHILDDPFYTNKNFGLEICISYKLSFTYSRYKSHIAGLEH
ncbi:hypothetical protein RRG08_021517 [Elysia crispata]|uniref:Uncharacterized protein n=1 Tax=Elysia crispata TaxID=231223 RepID=A0AAE1BBN3_9GAST|nr:hypothetical protein RRG08_021517 [Elysia crispata]